MGPTVPIAADHHPTSEQLEKFMCAELAPAELGVVLRHLVKGCEVCRKVTAPFQLLWQGDDSALPPVAEERLAVYDPAIDRICARARAERALGEQEERLAERLLEELARHPLAHQRLLVLNSPRFRSSQLCENLLVRSHEAGFRDPGESRALAQLALIIAQALEPQEPAESSAPVALLGTRARNLQARAWAQLGNALRIQADFGEAEKAFAQAELVLDDSGRNGQLDRARICDLLASLRRDQSRHAEAFQLYELAIAIYQKLGRWHLLGRTLAQKSMVCGEVGESALEMKLLRRALDLLDPQEEPRMFLAARHNLILALNESGRHREAFALLFHTRPLYLQNGDRMNLLRLRWLEGQVSLGLGRIEQAETAFREVRQSFLGLDLAYEAALASLDLAAVYAIQRRNAEMRELAEEMFVIFQSRHIHREAMAAILVFHGAAAAEQVELDLVREVAAFLRRSRTDPELQFSRSS